MTKTDRIAIEDAISNINAELWRSRDDNKTGALKRHRELLTGELIASRYELGC